MRALSLLSAALLAACGPQGANPSEAPANAAAESEAALPGSGGGLPDPPAPPPPAQSLPGLAPLTGEQIRAELGAGPYCTLSDGGGPLMVAKLGDAIVSNGGRIVHLRPEARDWAALGEGGRFASQEVAVEVNAGAVVERFEELVERDASAAVLRGGRGFSVSHGPRWACGT